MSSLLKKILSSFIFATVLLVSMLGICKQVLDTSCVGCVQHETTMLDAAIHQPGADCGQIGQACSGHSGDHMTTFASLYPATPTDAAGLATVLFVVFAAAFVFDTKNHLLDVERMRAQTRSYIRKRLSASGLDFLVTAFSRGILHSKIYA